MGIEHEFPEEEYGIHKSTTWRGASWGEGCV